VVAWRTPQATTSGLDGETSLALSNVAVVL
jgi:hypothetical protein